MISEGEAYTRMMFGIHAVRCPVQLQVQKAGEGIYSAVLITTGDLTFGSKRVHQLIMGDAVIRPALAMETDKFAGRGLGGLALTTLGEWAEEGRVLLNPAELDPNRWK